MQKNPEILVVDDDVGLASNLKDILGAESYDVTVAHSGKAALSLDPKNSFDLAIIDVKLPDIPGAELIQKLIERFPKGGEYIIITGYASLDTAIEVVGKRHVVAYLTKPLDMDNLLALIRQVVERRRAEKALQESEERYRAVVNLGAEVGEAMVMLQDTDSITGLHVFVSDEWSRITGYSKKELLSMSMFDLVHPGYRDAALGRYKIRSGGGNLPGLYEVVIIKKGGTEIPVEVTGAYTTYKEKPAAVVFIRDITDRKRTQAQIEQAAKEWRTTFDSITDMISIHDRNFRLTRVNKAFADTFKMKPKQIVGQCCYEMIHKTKPVPDCPFERTIEDGKPHHAEFFESSLGMYLEVSTSPILDEKGKVVACVHVARDISERVKMEEQLIITDRLASIGELASGIAHELNNPLTSVIGFSDLLMKKDIPAEIKDDLELIHREANRTAQVVKNLLIFARKHPAEKHPVDINKAIQAVLELRAYEQKVQNINVRTQFAPSLPEMVADGFQLQQVFLNIVINAEHFMSEAHGGGTLTITTEHVDNIVRASFIDDGPGIAPDSMGHIFDPFYTTKVVGKGTGLGLSVCHGIITEHGGKIYAQSKFGNGATIVVELPLQASIKVE